MRKSPFAWLVFLFVAVVLLAPNAGARDWYYYPPFSVHGATHSPVGWGGGLNIDSLTPVNADGTLQVFTYSEADGIGAYGNTVYAIFAGKQFSPPYDDYYTIAFYWTITASVRPCVFIGPWGSSASRAAMWLQGNLWDLTSNRWVFDEVLHPETVPTTTLIDVPGNILTCTVDAWHVTSQYFPLVFSAPLFHQHSYELHARLKLFTSAASDGVSSGYAYSGLTALSGHWMEMIYLNTPPGPCVRSGTPTLLPDMSTVKVDKVEEGDTVMGYNLSTGQLVPVQVTGNSFRHVDQILSINNGLLDATPTDQPIYVRNGTWEGWVADASHLAVGEQVFLPASGGWANITRLETLSGNFKVFDLRTDGPHNFIANGVLVLDKV